MTLHSAIYEGAVVHDRLRPKRHRLKYHVYSMLLDIDELPDLARRFWLFGYNSWAPLAFYDRDHGLANGSPLRPWVESHLMKAGLPIDGGPIRLLCYPRVFGYVFNPLSVYFCYNQDGQLRATLYEVCNTFEERHTYVIAVHDNHKRVIRQRVPKAMYVSPFIGMDAAYHFRIVPPSDRTIVVIRQEDTEGVLLAASFVGTRQKISGWSLIKVLCRFPLLTVKIMFGIHWEALRLLLKGLKVFAHEPAANPIDSSIGHPTTSKS